MRLCLILLCVSIIGLTITSCTKHPKADKLKSAYLFKEMLPSETGVDFKNTLVESQENNHILSETFVLGAGVAVGDINNDGLPDIYFSGNQVGDQLYLNKGNLKFENISKQSGILNRGSWSTGVTMADVNKDGFLDIYVCKNQFDDRKKSRNELYINNGDLTFSESAKSFGIADPGFSIQGTFFDYNKDGNIDLYLINQPPSRGSYQDSIIDKLPEHVFTDKLYQNLGAGLGFSDVSYITNTRNLAHGLSSTVGDLNNNGWPDLYVTNDYHQPDHFFQNLQNGKFKDQILYAFKHISNFSMGSDIADYDNDGLLDIMVVDMVAEDHHRNKIFMGGMNIEKFEETLKAGGHYQYMFNTLQRNNGNGTFSDLAQLAGVSKTDWSWSPLFVDLDNDGFKDLFITNGINRNMRHSDIISKQKSIVDSLKNIANDTSKIDALLLAKMAPIDPFPNYAFKNNGDLTFDNKSEAWGFEQQTFSNGSAYADLDLDGDMDLIISNINQNALIYANTASDKGLNNYLNITLKPDLGSSIYGAKVSLYRSDTLWQMIELTNARGYMSKSDDLVHFGLGKAGKVEEIRVEWNDGTVSIVNNTNPNQLIRIDQKQARIIQAVEKPSTAIFKDITSQNIISHHHKENDHNDFEKEVLLPHKMSQFGPSIAVGDVNGDNLEDLFVGGAIGFPATLFIQDSSGHFIESSQEIWQQDLKYEDMGLALFDADGDKDLDLYIVSGGNEFTDNSAMYQDRLYINDGSGKFNKDESRLPTFSSSGSVVLPCDYDRDGDIDLFVGGRLVAQTYPTPASSQLLINNNGHFEMANTSTFENLGLVTDATWTDINADGQIDLVVVGEWMPVTSFIQKEGAFKKVLISGFENTEGWYYSIASSDMDGDGDEDLITGNLGLNYKYKATQHDPFEVYYYDFDDNGSGDIVLSYFEHGQLFPVRGRSCSIEQMPSLSKKFSTFESFGASNLDDIYGTKLNNALHLKAKTFASSYFENINGKSFTRSNLPPAAQVSSINNILVRDFDKDGNKDLLLSGNLFSSEIETPRNDAGNGIWLKGNGQGGFKTTSIMQSGFYAPMDAKDMKIIQCNGFEAVLIANNDHILQVVKIVEK